MTDTHSIYRTVQFARVLGPFLAITSIVAMVRTSRVEVASAELARSALWPMVLGALGILGGITIVTFHRRWRGGAAILVSSLGWLLVVRGLLLMLFPEWSADAVDRSLGASALWLIVDLGFGAAGLYLVYIGWWPPQRTFASSEHTESP
ncbi:hypothetical protein [Mycolicibacterium parafortuitum]|uniref:Uncharacterized protein n=1 Tax=Mycolicibacterium parafortuitum TaxID=39692 RepID=A0A375YND1_MYCPF|nr:hypothetical protein [Mycolicibacterium parafortuitum]ORB28619.1 hypothetical protein BST38_19420 [Mycolicibacterium parafortuitum]SRX82494.1 hypothetical protein MPP7335_04254 [Mycolicibacterium parafortuitum]